MRAVVVTQPGGPEVLVVQHVEPWPLGSTDVRIRVAASGVNRADVAQRQGTYPSPEGTPEWPGLEVSGTVTELGDDVRGFSVGDRVCALLSGGGYAEDVVVDAGLVLPVPKGIELIDAAALPEVAATVWSNLFQAAEVDEGDVVLIHGGASGIGTMAIQLAKAAGATVAVTAGSAEKLAVCAELGADTLINYREETFVERMRRDHPGGANVILDIIGGAYAADNIRALATGGTIMVIANQSGTTMEFNPFSLMLKRGRIWGTTLRARPIDDKRAIMAELAAHVWPWIEEGRVRPVVDSTFPFSRASEAHARMEASQHIGKILLTPDS